MPCKRTCFCQKKWASWFRNLLICRTLTNRKSVKSFLNSSMAAPVREWSNCSLLTAVITKHKLTLDFDTVNFNIFGKQKSFSASLQRNVRKNAKDSSFLCTKRLTMQYNFPFGWMNLWSYLIKDSIRWQSFI